MVNRSLIKDNNLRRELEKIDKKLNRIESIKQLPSDTSLSELISVVNKITDSLKRKQ